VETTPTKGPGTWTKKDSAVQSITIMENRDNEMLDIRERGVRVWSRDNPQALWSHVDMRCCEVTAAFSFVMRLLEPAGGACT
jgi:hypothetical protein